MKKMLILLFILLFLIIGGGVFVVKSISQSTKKSTPSPTPNLIDIGNLPENKDVVVSAVKSKTKDNTVVVKAEKLNGSYSGIAYEVTYETNGSFQGVNSGTKPIDVTGEKEFTRDVYLGTCSRNVCKPHTGVAAISVVLQFTDKDGNQSQISKEFAL